MATGTDFKTITEVMHTKIDKLMRWIGNMIPVGLLVAGVGMTAGCVSQDFDLVGEPPYAGQVGERYELAVDSYIVTLKEADELYLVNRYSSFRQPLPVDAKYLGKCTGELNIKGVLLKGAIMKVAAIKGTESFDAGRYVHYYLETGDEASGLRIRVNVCFLETCRGGVFSMNEQSFIRRSGVDKAGGVKQ